MNTIIELCKDIEIHPSLLNSDIKRNIFNTIKNMKISCSKYGIIKEIKNI